MELYLYIGIGILGLVLGYALILFNQLINQRNVVKEAFATMDVYLKKRWDLIPNVVEVVKGYAEHEKETLEEMIRLRSGAYESMSMNDKINTNEKITSDVSKLIMLAEAYPELKANESFLNLSNQLAKVEEDIANSRKYFNATVRDLNNLIEVFPNNVFAKIFGFKSMPMFETDSNEREKIKVTL